MRILDTTPITDAAELPIKSGTLQFLQDANKELFLAVVQALLSPSYNPAIMYVLYGCVNSGAGSTYNISSGVVLWQGELFYVDATNFAATITNTAICTLGITQYVGNGVNADPVQFTDMTEKNVHDIRKIVITQGASGSGLADYSTLTFCNFVIPPQLALTASGPIGGVPNAAQVLGAYPNQEIFVPGNNNLGAVVALGTAALGDVPSGGVTIPIVFPGGPLTGVVTYQVQLTLVSTGGHPNDDISASVGVIQSTQSLTGFSFRAQEWFGTTQSLQVNWICFKMS